MAMEKLVYSAASTAVPTQQFSFRVQHSFFPAPGLATRTFLQNHRTELGSQLCCRSKYRHSKAFTTKQEQLQIHREEEDDDMSFLSLSEKPDRNLGLLDDYETEELDYDCGPNHRSGSSPFSFAKKLN